ncbi:uncharacterized protein A4U43_C09F13610 [Asparagus officinalis]|uniref:Uncharacterized protein n=1 Tax=Asparagus officinalis TaxID=4686 RepID=A0A5P1E972_ASPOF|nr:uncharacterized protein A4U43_C09F13610 [Asparagus officinalis]
MACRTVIMRSAVLLSPCNRVAALSSSFSSASVFSRHRSRVRVFRSSVPLRCSSSSSNGENTPPPQQDGEQSPPQEVNSYPMVRGFTAIGTGGDDFVQAMVVAVESVLQEPIPKGQISQKVSSRGKYVSVNIGPIRVVSSEQVQAVYNAMRRDDRMKYFL